MKTVGFPISYKENEKRRAILPDDLSKLSHPECVFIEKGYGEVLGISDDEYVNSGCNVCSREEVLQKDIICDPKIGDAEYLHRLKKGQVIFGWIHATQNRIITDTIVNNGLTAYAWEKMFYCGRHIFWFNNELAGEAAVLNAFQCYGMLPFGLNVAVIGNGNTARGAIRALNMLGSIVIQYNRKQEVLLRKEIGNYDVIVNCVLWDLERKDHIISKKDLLRMKKGSMIIDVSCDRNGGIETSIPTTISNPTYCVEGIIHYVVDHTPSLFYKTFSVNNSKIIAPFIEKLITSQEDEVLLNCLIIEDGIIRDQEIIDYQHRRLK